MGMNPSPEYCHITDLKTENHPSSIDLTEYIIDVNNKRLFFRFSYSHKNSEFVESNKYILKGLILNEKFPMDFNTFKTPVLDNKKLEKIINESIIPQSPEEKIINESIIPQSPEEKIKNLLTYLHSLQEFEGSVIKFPNDNKKQDLAYKLYFKNYQEMAFYLFTLYNQGLIDGIDASSNDGNELIDIKFTFEGLSKVIELAESGQQSNRCFIAMSFSDDLIETRNSIKQVIIETGFKPILIDELHYDSEVTINDALIAEIKKSKFLVADFTQHKHGVYFEAGYALGLKRPVVYLCHEEEFSNSHFDTNHYPHIIYKDLNELKAKLKLKIEAWIK